MSQINLVDLFKQLKQPTTKASEKDANFSALPIPDFESHRLAKDINNFPCLLISTQDKTEVKRPAPIKLEYLDVMYDVNCRISYKGALENNRFTVICCKTFDASMQEYFLRTSNTIIELIGDSPTSKQVSKAVDNLVELFRVLKESPKKSVQGIWAEVFLISISSNPLRLLKAWHQEPDDKFDFSEDNQRIEVKSATSSTSRKHHFSLEQLNPAKGVEAIVASVFVERVGAGTSLVNLLETVKEKMGNEPEYLLYLEQMIATTLGNNWRQATKDTFDYQLAKKNVKFFNVNAIPSVDINFPKVISKVHFMVDLTNIPFIDKKFFKEKENLFKAVSTK